MKRFTVAIAAAAAALLLAEPLLSCGPHFPVAVFAYRWRPEPPLEQFAAGRLGVIQPEWEPAYLYVAYRYLAGVGFDADEQRALLAFWNEKPFRGPNPEAEAGWLTARGKVPSAPVVQNIIVFRAGPQPYAMFVNCNDDAFRTAAATLDTMIGRFGASSAEVKRWLAAQDEVFQNCYEPTPPGTAYIPGPLVEATPFEQAQRTYQIACANFYSKNFDTAAKMFTAIAADSSSPWQHLAPYLVARTTIRKATLSAEKNDNAILAQAQQQLNALIAAPGSDGIKPAAQRLLGFVNFRLHPEQLAQSLAEAVMKPASGASLKDDLADYLRVWSSAPQTGDFYSQDLPDWMSSFPNGDPAHAIAQWKKTSSLPWLLAALSRAPANDPSVPDLIGAADKVTPDSPAFATVAYHTARILIEQGKTDDARARLDAILAKRDTLPRGTANQFAALRMGVSRDLGEFLRYAQRTPIALETDNGESLRADWMEKPYVQELARGPLFDDDGAEILGRWLPLSMLTQAAHSEVLPPILRRQVALAAWIRAILLGHDTAARDVATVVEDLVPELKTAVQAWLASPSPEARRFEAAYAMLRNPGARPYIDPGPGRMMPLGEIDLFRDNWWCSLDAISMFRPLPGDVAPKPPPSVEKYPGFLSATDRKRTAEEWQKLSAIDGPEFLCEEAIAQVRRSPKDPRVPEALYRCVGAVHLGCSNKHSDELAESAFTTLHSRYPDSDWARKSKVWHRGAQSSSNPHAPFFLKMRLPE